MTTRPLALAIVVAFSLVSCAAAQEAAPKPSPVQTEVLATMESLANALMTGNLEGLKQVMRFPLVAALVAGPAAPRVEEVTEGLLTEDAAAAASARYGLARKVRFVEPTVVPLALNIAVFASPIEWLGEAGNVVVEDRMAAFLAKGVDGWRICALVAGDVEALEPDQATRQALESTMNDLVKAVTQQAEAAYIAAFSPPVIDMDPVYGVRRLGASDLQAQYRQFMYLVADAGLANALVETRQLVMLGPNAACVTGVAKGFDAAGTQVGYRAQAALLVKEAEKWKIVALAAGIPAEGTAPEGLLAPATAQPAAGTVGP